MTDERNKADIDTIVSDSYRALGDEKAPEHLNHAVLEMAKNASARRNSLRAGWMKPVAWAATIGLCLAIVLQLTELPDATQTEFVVPSAEPRNDSFEVRDTEIIEKAEQQLHLQQGRIAAQGDSAKTIQRQTETIEVPRLEAKRSAESYGVSAPSYGASAPSPSVSAEPVPSQERRSDQVLLPATMSDAFRDEESRCSATARRTADDWLACIENLRDLGDDQAADEESRAFREQFPDEFANMDANK